SETMDVKIAALRAHQSQVKDFAGLEEMLREWGRHEAQGQGMTYAEAFKRVILK
ncbi:MAG: PIG-L family deacetylase, partial [Chloroflexi bacterium]|nr:PIG-L family deacetylase [Chloroflexota bacterium]